MKIENAAANALVCISILPSVVGIILALIGIRSFVAITAYGITLFFLLQLRGKKTRLNFGVWSVLLYLFFFLFSMTYTISKVASEIKFAAILLNILLPISYLIIVFKHKICLDKLEAKYFEKVNKFAGVFSIVLVLMLLVGLTEKGDDFEGRDTIIGMANAIWSSRLAGFLALFPIISFFRNGKMKRIEVVGLISAIYIMIRSASRGPILSLVVSLILVLFPKVKMRYKIITVIMLIVFYNAFLYFSPRTFYGGISDSTGRKGLVEYVLDSKFDETTIIRGFGIGSFQLAFFDEDVYHYPHNIFVETFTETGLIGISFFILFLVALFRRRKNSSLFSTICLYFFINSQFSGDIAGNNYFFIFATVILLSSNICHKQLVYK